LNKADRLWAEVRIPPGLDQASGGFDGLAEPDVVAWDAQQLPAQGAHSMKAKKKRAKKNNQFALA
jgi:hypothetical protein